MPGLFGGSNRCSPWGQPLKLNVAAHLGHCNVQSTKGSARMDARLIDFKYDGAVIAQSRISRRMINRAPKRRKPGDERLVPENMIDTKAILFLGRAPSPFSPIAMPFAPQVDEVSVSGKRVKKIGAMEARAGPLDIEFVAARVEIPHH